MRRVVIIGAGMAGLGAAWALLQAGSEKMVDVELIESESRPGGLCRTEMIGSFTFDHTSHLLHFRSDAFRDLVLSVMHGELEQRQRDAWIYSNGVFTPYPFQANLYGLPEEVVVECIAEYCLAKFAPTRVEPRTFEEWINVHLGKGIARHFMIPYNTKVYRCPPAELSPEAGGRFVPGTDLGLLIRGAISQNRSGLGYNASFFYPKSGGIEALVRKLSGLFPFISLNETVIEIDAKRRLVYTTKGRAQHYDALVSSAPLPRLVEAITDCPEEVREAARSLKWVSVLNIHLGVIGETRDWHWLYVPEDRYVFHRVGFAHNYADSMAPSLHSALSVEIAYDPVRGIDRPRMVERAIEDLVLLGILDSADQVVAQMELDMAYGYVVFDHARRQAVDAIRTALEPMGIYPVGRFGAWEYSSMEDAFLSGRDAATTILKSI